MSTPEDVIADLKELLAAEADAQRVRDSRGRR
jgi:hypothetical protein